MNWYLNDASFQGQFADQNALEKLLRELLLARSASRTLRERMKVAQTTISRPVVAHSSLRECLISCTDRELKSAALQWLDKAGPFVDASRTFERDDYFECLGVDVTDGGLGEAARCIKGQDAAAAFSVPLGTVSFALNPLEVDHGVEGDRLGVYPVPNLWSCEDLVRAANNALPSPTSWKLLIEQARERFPALSLPNELYSSKRVSCEPFNDVIAASALRLMAILHELILAANSLGFASPGVAEIIAKHFSGSQALFTAESQTNQSDFKADLTFPDPSDPSRYIFAHWHGKIASRVYRLHFQWPLPPGQRVLKVLYFGPKITKR